MIWYPCTVATLSRRLRDVIEDYFDQTTDLGSSHPLIESRLHDFGYRGCTTPDQAVIGGSAHLLNFTGTDTMSAAYYTQARALLVLISEADASCDEQFHLNEGEPIGNSIPATEHSVMMAWDSEKSAVLNMIERFGNGTFACVLDSYDYTHALEHLLPSIAKEKLKRGGFMVLRPDSGDPTDAILKVTPAAVTPRDVTSHAGTQSGGFGVWIARQ